MAFDETVRFYGSSDDTVHVTGAIEGDLHPPHAKDYLTFALSDGTLLKVSYDTDGRWRIAVLKKGDARHSYMSSGHGDAPDYSMVLDFDAADLDWVAVADSVRTLDGGGE